MAASKEKVPDPAMGSTRTFWSEYPTQARRAAARFSRNGACVTLVFDAPFEQRRATGIHGKGNPVLVGPDKNTGLSLWYWNAIFIY